MKKQKVKKYPEGHFPGQYMAIFMPLGLVWGMLVFGPAMIGAGIGIGLVMGLAIGKSVEEKYKKKGMIRPLTKKEKHNQKIVVVIGIGALVLGVLVAFMIVLFM